MSSICFSFSFSGSNLLLQRIMAKKGVPSDLTFVAFDSTTSLCTSSYVSLQKNWWSLMFMRVVAPLNVAKSQGFSIILNWSTILDIMYGKIIPLPSTPNRGGENGTFGLLHGFIVDLGGMGGGDSVQDCSLLRIGRYEFLKVVSGRNRRRLCNK